MATHRTESEEWVAHRVESWVETYKKAMLTPVILGLITHLQPVTIAELRDEIATATSWQLTERGLYRTIKRLIDTGLLASTDVAAPRTGAKRKELSLTSLGTAFFTGVAAAVVELPT